jgi:predicted 2-oxoglutarate/Fe(II)-dependent dioxygenase YbiX
MDTRVTPRSELLVEIDGFVASIVLPEDMRAAFADRLRGPFGSIAGPPEVRYEITGHPPDRYSLERGHAGMRHNIAADVAIEALVADLLEVLHRRRPDLVFADAGAVSWQGRGIVVLGSGPPTRQIDALVEKGATLLSCGLTALDRSGHVLPILTGATPSADAHDRTQGSTPSAAPLTLVAAAGPDPEPVEITGTRAALALLEQVRPNQQRSPAARSLLGCMAPHVALLRSASTDADTLAEEILRSARRRPVVALQAAPPGAEDRGESADDEERVTPARHLRFDDFLSPEDHRRLLDHTLAREAGFGPSQVLSGEPIDDPREVRRSQTIFDLDEVWELFERQLVGLLPHIRRELDIDWFHLESIERQLTVHGDEDHFALHVDAAGPEVAARQVSAVYYFNREPQRFSGGELRLFDTVERGGVIEPAETFTEVSPTNNTLVVFGSRVPHEVRPVHVPGDAFEDRRFTIVCWARRTKTPAEVFTGDATELTDLQQELIPALTADGFRVVSTPAEVQARLADAFAAGVASAPLEDIDGRFLPDGTPSFVDVGETGAWVHEELRALHEEWYRAPLETTSYYGLRVYGEGQTLGRHTDRYATHVISSVVHVAADVDEPWPLVVEDRDGRRHDVFLEPGQMLLYEGARLPHSRPLPLRGRHYASLFLHYRPTDWPHTLDRVCREAASRSTSS